MSTQLPCPCQSLSKLPPVVLQESRETLLRLKRMAGFESQDFDPLVTSNAWSPLLSGLWSCPLVQELQHRRHSSSTAASALR